MKKSIKRLFALLLTLCTLASLLVPVAFANTETETPSVYAAETYKIRVKDLANTDPANPTDEVDGKFVTTTDGVASFNSPYKVNKLTGYYDTWGWKYYADSNGLSYYIDQMYMARLPYKGWAALQIKVADAGLYALNLKTDKTADDETEVTPWTNLSFAWTGDVSAYIIPLGDVDAAIAAGTTTSTDDEGNEVVTAPAAVDVIADLMTEKYSVGTVNMAADADNITFAKKRMEAGEYVVVYYAENNFSISEMSLLTTAADAAQYELKDVVNYPIRLVDPTVPAASATGSATWFGTDAYTNTQMAAIATKLSDAYAAGDLNWKYLATNASAAKNVIYRTNVNMMLRTVKNELIALQIKVPTSGNYFLTVASDRTASYDTGLTYALTEYPTYTAYMVNVKDLEADVTAENIASLAVDANSVGSVELAEGVTSGVFNKTYLEAGEYVLIFTHDKSTAAISDFTLAQRAYEIMPEDEEEVIEDTTYKFDLYNNERYAPVFTTPETGETNNRSFTSFALTGLDGVYEAGAVFGDILLNDYNNGLLNWKKVDANLDSFTFEPNSNGLRLQNKTADAQYGALCINVPATAMYTVNVVGASNDADVNVYVYDADAEGDVAANMTDANLAGSIATSATTLTFSKILTAGENIIVFEVAGITGTSTKETFKLNSIVLSVNDDPSSISFDLSTNEAYKAALAAKVSGAEEITYTWGSTATMNKFGSYVDANEKAVRPYGVLATMFLNGEIDWALDYAVNTNSEPTKAIHPYEGSMRLRMLADGTGYTGIRLRIKNAGLHNVTVNATTEGDPITAYLFPAETAYTSYSDCVDLSSYLIDANKLGVAADKNSPITASFNVEESGEYILVLTGNNNVFLSSMDLEPVEAAAYADGVACGSFEEAMEKATESVLLCENTSAGDLVVNAGVTLDLNGYALYANSVDAKTAPGAEIIDSSEGKGVIRGEVEFAENNAQLPLYDVAAYGYRLFTVDVVSSATTGSGNSTKYWFKVNFANSDALALIGADTEMRIMASMTGVFSNKNEALAGQAFTATATAPASFTNAWAAKNASYIVLSSVGSSGVESFELNPAVTANGVIISGDAMTKG